VAESDQSNATYRVAAFCPMHLPRKCDADELYFNPNIPLRAINAPTIPIQDDVKGDLATAQALCGGMIKSVLSFTQIMSSLSLLPLSPFPSLSSFQSKRLESIACWHSEHT
jgi:hypothetical protein